MKPRGCRIESLDVMPRALRVEPRELTFVADAPLNEAQDRACALVDGQAIELASPAEEDRILGIVPSDHTHLFRLGLAIGELLHRAFARHA